MMEELNPVLSDQKKITVRGTITSGFSERIVAGCEDRGNEISGVYRELFRTLLVITKTEVS